MPVARSSRSMAQITYYRSSVLYDDIADTVRARASTTVIHEIFEGRGILMSGLLKLANIRGE